MKTLYSESEEEEKETVTVVFAEPTKPSREKGGASTSASRHEEVIVEESG